MNALMDAKTNREMFSKIVPKYDLLNSILSLGLDRYWRNRTATLLEPAKGKCYLDLGCGTGAMSLELISKCESARVIGLDPVYSMLRAAKKNFEKRRFGKTVKFVVGDAMKMPFRKEVFDGMISGFCIRNISDQSAVFEETYRVVKTGGNITVLELTRPQNFVIRIFHRIYNRTVLPIIGGLFSNGSAYKYLAKSIEKFPEQKAIIEMISRAGWKVVEAIKVTAGIVSIFIARK